MADTLHKVDIARLDPHRRNDMLTLELMARRGFTPEQGAYLVELVRSLAAKVPLRERGTDHRG